MRGEMNLGGCVGDEASNYGGVEDLLSSCPGSKPSAD